ncbi:MAG TPA: ATP12 family chaperone protein, partial [Xanthobacteraceae bacterium]|nr:ATP12 family chaperone protein [Xanthobacteraceae bacterium]
MRDLFETIANDDPIAAARRGARPPLRRRFYDCAAIREADGSFSVTLDAKPVRTPARRMLAAPSRALGLAIAAEWQAQRDLIDPATMPLTRLANAVIDGVADSPGPVVAEIEKYLA